MKHLILIAAMLFASPALAADDIRTVDMTAVLTDIGGHPLKDFADANSKDDAACSKCANLTLGAAIDHALKAQFPDEQNIPGEQRWARAILGDRIREDSSAKLTVKEADIIERLIMKAYGGDVIKQIIPKIDPNKKPPELQ